MVPVFLVAWVLLNRTRFGQTVFAIGGSEEAANLMGLHVVRTQVLLYTMMGFLSGLAGMLVAARSSSGLSTIGIGLELDAIAAVVIGGTLLTGGSGGLGGTIAGVLLLTVIQNLINQVGTLSSYIQQVVSGVFLIVVIVVQRLLGTAGPGMTHPPLPEPGTQTWRTERLLADGRRILYFDDEPGRLHPEADLRQIEPVDARSTLRHDPIDDEWVIVAAHRQVRTHLPPPTSVRCARPPRRGRPRSRRVTTTSPCSRTASRR